MQFLADNSDIITLSEEELHPNSARAVMRPFLPGDPEQYANPLKPRAQRIVSRALALSEEEVCAVVDRMFAALAGRPRNAEDRLRRHFDRLNGSAINVGSISKERQLLIAAYFCAEYSFEAAALFNPSMIPHPEGSHLPGGGLRFLLALRGVGEGHVSSVTFRTGGWSRSDGFSIDRASDQGIILRVTGTEGEGEGAITHLERDCDCDISEMVIFPTTASQRQGIEDMRLVTFAEPDRPAEIFGTYTAFDGLTARPEMMRGSSNLERFTMQPLRGRHTHGKGMALFPRKIGGRYMMLARQDQENIWLLESDDLYEWNEGRKLLEPASPWEFIQLGNCGSPIEIDEGWLVLTHGVGVVRSYTIGACLLDRDDPSKVIGRLAAPLIRPGAVARGGYVPNVVYSCGGLVHDRTLLLPYAVADSFTRFASVPIDALLQRMEDHQVADSRRQPALAAN